MLARARLRWLNRAAHIRTAAHRRLDFTFTFWTFGDLHNSAISQGQIVIDQRFLTIGATGIDPHIAHTTTIRRHFRSPHPRSTYATLVCRRCICLACFRNNLFKGAGDRTGG